VEAANKEAKYVRSAGVLLHPTSLPGPYGVGDLGPAAYAWVDALVRARQTWWQILPLNPTGYGDSPYQSVSTFAGNPYLLSPEVLMREGLVQPNDLGGVQFPADRVDFGRVIDFKLGMLGRAWERFRSGAAPGLRQPFDAFCSEQAGWLDDFALFMALKKRHNHAHWLSWPADLVRREPAALDRARRELADAVGYYKFGQFLFRRQWTAVKRYANDRDIRLMGDVPIFVASDSADVWANPGLFLLDAERRPRVVAGVPPDYFSSTGQLWGNPLYNWEALKRTGYAWWVDRLRATLAQVDVVRLDHFRGFEAYWEVPASHTTAAEGRWVKGPGADLFQALRRALGGLPFIAEDLGLITPEVRALREQVGLPGMRVLQFAFGDTSANPYLPHNYDRNTVVYTGTHDNDTTRGWYAALGDKEKWFLHRYAPHVGPDIAWDLMRLAWGSVADYALAPLQDVLSLGNEARMNLPGRPAGNWSWRYTPGMLNDGVLDRLGDLTEVYGRHPGAPRPS
jgi:4-alpha-glucanotransferase